MLPELDFDYNRDVKRRNKLLGISEDTEWFGGVAYFKDLDVETLKILLDEKFADPDDCQNAAPSIGQIYDFMQEYPKFKAHGYAVVETRFDYRISIEGVTAEDVEPEELAAFAKMFHDADDFIATRWLCHCWFD